LGFEFDRTSVSFPFQSFLVLSTFSPLELRSLSEASLSFHVLTPLECPSLLNPFPSIFLLHLRTTCSLSSSLYCSRDETLTHSSSFLAFSCPFRRTLFLSRYLLERPPSGELEPGDFLSPLPRDSHCAPGSSSGSEAYLNRTPASDSFPSCPWTFRRFLSRNPCCSSPSALFLRVYNLMETPLFGQESEDRLFLRSGASFQACTFSVIVLYLPS